MNRLLWSLMFAGAMAGSTPSEWIKRLDEAKAFADSGQTDKAVQMLEAVVQQAKDSQPNPAIAAAWNNLGTMYQDLNRTSEAEDCYRHSIDLWKQTSGDKSGGLSGPMNNLAGIFKFQGRYAAADKLYSESLEIRRKAFGEHHPRTVTVRSNLAHSLELQGRIREAIKEYERSLVGWEKGGPEFDKDRLWTYNNLGQLHWRLHKYSKALELLTRAATQAEQILGKNNPGLIAIHGNLAAALLSANRQEEALEEIQRARHMADALPDANPLRVMTISNHATMLRQMNRKREAEALEAELKRLPLPSGQGGSIDVSGFLPAK